MRDPRAVYRVVGVLVRHAVAGRPRDLRRAGARHDRFARRGRRPARPPRRAPAKADHHRAQPRPASRCAACSTSPTRWRFRWRACRADRFRAQPRHPGTLRRIGAKVEHGRAHASRSRSRICSAARRRCSTAPRCAAGRRPPRARSPAPAARSAPSCRARSRRCRPARLVLLDNGEFALYAIDMRIARAVPAAGAGAAAAATCATAAASTR